MKLKPCPFCGGRAKLKSDATEKLWWIICQGKCLATIPPMDGKEDIIEAWNMRIK